MEGFLVTTRSSVNRPIICTIIKRLRTAVPKEYHLLLSINEIGNCNVFDCRCGSF